MGMITKQFALQKQGEWMVINTAVLDRDRDRVLPGGAVLDNYLRNPVVMYGHNYRDPWAVIGRSAEVMATEADIRARPELRAPVGDQDPMHIIRALWDADLLAAGSIGFNPLEWVNNAEGGRDYTRWELLEWSLVPIPANQEALRLAVKGIGTERSWAVEAGDEAWIRRLAVRSGLGEQTVFAAFRTYDVTVPEDATKPDLDADGRWVLVPDPNAGKTLHRKEVSFVPPIRCMSDWGEDAIYMLSGETRSDEEFVKAEDGEWLVSELSEVLLSLPGTKGAAAGDRALGLPLCRARRSEIKGALAAFKEQLGEGSGPGRVGREILAIVKRGRVLSAANEQRIRDAVAALEEVLAQLEAEPEEPAPLTLAAGEKAVVPYSAHGDCPTADEDTAWDGDAARARLQAWAGGEDWEPARYRQGFVLVEGDAGLLGSYRGPHHDVENGTLQVVWAGVRAAMGSLVFGARGGGIRDEGDRRAVYDHLAAHYRQFDKDVPEFKETSGDAGEELTEAEEEALAAAMESLVAAAQGWARV